MVKIIYKNTKTDLLDTKKEKIKRRNFAERKRRHRLIVGFYNLSRKIPTYLKTNIFKKMIRCQILNYAIQYIKQLHSFLEQDNKEKEINNGQLQRIQNE